MVSADSCGRWTRAPRTAAACGAVLVAALLSAAAGGALPVASPEDEGFSSERLARVAEVVARHIDAGDVAGAVTLVARHGRIVHFEAQGYMDIESRSPMRTDTIFRMASMSKPITAVAVMMLVEEGKIRLADPVSRHIPELAGLDEVAVPRADGAEGYDVVPADRAVTVHDLLTHVSGLASGGLGSRAVAQLAPRSPQDTLATYIPKLGAVPLDFQPGALWRYSGLAGFDVLARIVEVASGQTFDRFLEERLFTPLGMPDTRFHFAGQQASRVATLYALSPEGLRPRDQALNPVYFSGAGGLAGTAGDYARFAQMLLNGGELDGRRYLGPRTVELMTANHTGDMVNGQFGRPQRGMGFGLSVQVVEDPVAAGLAVSKGAYGWAGGTGVSVWIEPAEDMITIFMTQGGSGGALRGAFENAVRQAIID